MHHDQDNDCYVSEEGSITISPEQIYWHASHSVTLEIDGKVVSVPVNQLDDLIDGLTQVKQCIDEQQS
jgi:hypothetical protein